MLTAKCESVVFNSYVGCTQLQRFCKDHIPALLRETLPSKWVNSDVLEWYPDDENYNHPTENWLKSVWDYLREYFERDLHKLANLPLIPLDLSQRPIKLTKMATPSKVVTSKLSESEDLLDSSLCDVLKALGVMVMNESPHFLKSHPGIEKFVHPPSVKGVLQAMLSSSSVMGIGMHSAILSKVQDDGRRSLRKLIAKVSSLSSKEKEYLSCLPVFETLSQEFVSKKQVLSAAPREPLPVTPRGDFIDVKEDDSVAVVRLLGVRIPTLIEFLCNRILPDVNRGHYSAEEIDKLMFSVLCHIDTDTRLEEEMKALKFVPTNSGRRFQARELFHPRKDPLMDIFADEDVFPVLQYANPEVLRHLEKLGLKGEEDITAQDLYRSAMNIADTTPLEKAEKKSTAILSYLHMNPNKLQDDVFGMSLGLQLQDAPWISPVRVKPHDFPSSLPFYGKNETKPYFFKPTEVETEDRASIIGAIRPIVPVHSSSDLAKHFGWDKSPCALDVVKHFEIVVDSYCKDDKPHYMLMVEEIYSFLLGTDDTGVEQALERIKSSKWIWNGDGFSFPNAVLAGKPSIDLSPYIVSLPTEMNGYSELFSKCGMQEQCDVSCLLFVLQLIKQKYDDCEEQQFDSEDVERDLQLSINILNKVESEVGGALSPELLQEVLLPTFVKNDAYVKLAQVEDCVYLKHGSRSLNDDDDESMDHLLLHRKVPYSTAEYFNVRTLQNSMLDPDELGFGEECGQEEKLTSRLSTLLEDYTDGFAVPKELIQNADDAGATEVRFLYDERTNEDAMDFLFDEGMRECQGPALWVYNDAVFQNEDFENLTKLNGATKEEDTQKIGKFGLGFNAVYNLTDVPMLVSRNYFVIFDPNTFHLGRAIRNKNKPGIKIDTNKNVRKLRSFRHQFKPFNGIFGCDLCLEKEDNSFHGTLFRFPLRTKTQAIKSEIKQLVYDCKQMKELLQLFIKGAGSLLLFTQNIRRVRIFHLSKEATDATQPKLMFEVTKSLMQEGIIRKLSMVVDLPSTASSLSKEDKLCQEQCNFLKASTKTARFVEETENPSAVLLRSGLILDIQSIVTEDGHLFFQDTTTLPTGVETWLVASSMGNGEALKFSRSEKSLIPSAGVAVQLSLDNGSVSGPLCPLDFKGTLFCYLPLPIYSGLPVHVNGAFAVASNRRALKQKTNDDKACVGADWNNILFQDSVCAAYLDLLEDVKSSSTQISGSKYMFHWLWPLSCKVEKACEPLARSLYVHLASGKSSLFSDGEKWVSIHEVVFLDPHFRQDSEIGDVSFKVFQMLVSRDVAVIDLPYDVYKSFANYGYEELIHSKRYDVNRFFVELFFPNIGSVPTQLRDRLVMYALDEKNERLDEMIRGHKCIPTTPHGETLKCPSQLISPSGTSALLFSPLDERFPHGSGQTFLHPSRLFKLQQLGMLTDDLPWTEVAERAESISILNQMSTDAASKRAKNLIAFLENKLIRDGIPSSLSEDHSRILKAKFLPVLKKPKSFPLIWKGSKSDGGKNQVFVSSLEGFLSEHTYLVCCSQPIIEEPIAEKAKKFLTLDGKRPTVMQVIEQINEAISTGAGAGDAETEEIRKVCIQSYGFLQEALDSHETQISDFLQRSQFILVEDRFVPSNQVALKLVVDCPPYLYKLPNDLARRYLTLMKVAGVREVFQVEDLISALKRIKQDFQDENLDDKTLRVAINLAAQLKQSLEKSEVPITADIKRTSVYLPNSRGVMQLVSELCINDCPWISNNEGVQYVHPGIPVLDCYHLGVKTRRAEALRHYAYGLSFGQREELVNRLRRILEAFPCEKELLKELLQNADDAQATEICFVHDPRHHPKKKVFEECWEPLQGPALCVYNNKPFTQADIEGIQNLGQGGKGDDPNKTGKYGVGFNAVYHLTDVPSFMSSGEEIGDVLCVFDPHCRYVPGASSQEPGRMYTDTKQLKTVFPDVFSCYLEEHFPIENSTVFRFPLRTQEMAKVSRLTKTPITSQTLNEMMQSLKNELFEVLLFVNNVKKITVCDIDGNSGKMADTFSVEAAMSDEDEAKRWEFANHIKQIGKLAKEKGSVILNTEVKKCSYVMTLTDSDGNEEKWLIVQQFGFEKPVSESIVFAYRNQELGMIPRGGVACLLEKKSKKHGEAIRKKKAYCFLPLPIETNLPVHINGHFALDHEARRNLWWDEKSGYRSEWNNAILGDVVASCYLTLLDEVRGFYQLPFMANESENLRCLEDDLLERVRRFENLFPQFDGPGSHWNTLVRSVYRGMDEKRRRLLPVVRCASQSTDPGRLIQLKWFPPTGKGKDQAFFNNIDNVGSASKQSKHGERDLGEILIQTGFNLLSFSLLVFEAFKKSDVNTTCVSPSSVLDFFKTYSSQDSLGTVGIDISETPFENVQSLALLLRYCKRDCHFLKRLHGLPLLLTQDNILRVFDVLNPKFLSRYHDILPNSKDMFVHEHIRYKLFDDTASLEAPVFRRFDVQAFSFLLPHSLPACSFCRSDEYVTWKPDSTIQPNSWWISRVWSFLGEEVARFQRGWPGSILSVLNPLTNWNILPATEVQIEIDSNDPSVVNEQVLVPLTLAESVLDFREQSRSSPLDSALRDLGLAELNRAILSASSANNTFLASQPIARQIVASPEKPSSILAALLQKMRRNPQSLQGKLDPSSCKVILQYFSHNVEILEKTLSTNDLESFKTTLRKLPFYSTIDGRLVSLNEQKVCVIPSVMPREEMALLQEEVKMLFLESKEDLSKLFKFLRFDSISTVDVYCQSVLPHFQVFSTEARQKHLKYIRDSLLNDASDEYRLLQCLSNTEVISSQEGTLKKASSFYDPRNEVFKAMLPEESFPPVPYICLEWLPFMRKIGMIHEISRDHFIKFAREVAQEASQRRASKTDEKSKLLVSNLLKRSKPSDGLLQAVCNVRFVVSDPVADDLKKLHSQYGSKDDGLSPYISFQDSVVSDHTETVWTAAHILPRWADPRFCFEIKVPHYLKRDDFTSSILSALNVLSEPTVQMVISHCLNITRQVSKQNDKKFADDQGTTRKSLMRNIYKFFQRKVSTGNSIVEDLKNKPCILVEEGTRFVQSKQVVLELYESLEISPFLYRLPPELGEFQSLFRRLGCTDSVTALHYSMVLEMLHEHCQSMKLNPNHIKSSLKAVRGLFETLELNPHEQLEFQTLYLPAVYQVSRCSFDNLYKSTDLIFDDAPEYQSRLEKFDQLLVVDLKMAELQCSSSMNYKDYILRLPEIVRPQFLSKVIQERLTSSKENVDSSSTVIVADSLKKQLCSRHFFQGILRLIRHANHASKCLDETTTARLESRLRSIEFLGLNQIVTHLVYKESIIPSSEAEVPHFLEKFSESGRDVWKVYVNGKTEEGDTQISLTLTQVIAEACEGLLRETVMFIPEMLRTKPNKIWSILDHMKIRQDDSYDPSLSDLLPDPGDFIPIQDHHLLNEAFQEFSPGEYVGFELEDPSLENQKGDATFIYAIIVEDVSGDEDTSIYTKRYKVNVGHDKELLVAESADLYKFHQLHPSAANQKGSSTQDADREAIFRKITEVLKMVWRLPTRRKRKIIKRLFLQWHPERNIGDADLCKKVFQYLQNEIEKLERDDEESDQGSYKSFYHVWTTRAELYCTQRQEYRAKFVKTYGSWEASTSHSRSGWVPPSFCKKNPQPGEARRWFRQAEEDLKAAQEDLRFGTTFYEWVCFKCHQVGWLCHLIVQPNVFIR